MAFNNKESKVKFNICNAHIALKTTDSQGNVSYGEPWSFPGSRSLTLNVSGESTEFYADGILYYVAPSSGGYEGDWIVARILDKWRSEILKEFIDANGVMLKSRALILRNLLSDARLTVMPTVYVCGTMADPHPNPAHPRPQQKALKHRKKRPFL